MTLWPRIIQKNRICGACWSSNRAPRKATPTRRQCCWCILNSRHQNQSFHVIHQLKNKKVVIAKLVNRQDVLSILRVEKKLQNLDEGSKKRLKTQNIYINESLCPPYRKLLGKCNAPLKRKYISNFHSVNGNLKIKRGPTDDRATEVKHEDDLWQIFGNEIIDEINRRYKVSMEESQSAEQSPEQWM